jgi:hypothetical protein
MKDTIAPIKAIKAPKYITAVFISLDKDVIVNNRQVIIARMILAIFIFLASFPTIGANPSYKSFFFRTYRAAANTRAWTSTA